VRYKQLAGFLFKKLSELLAEKVKFFKKELVQIFILSVK